MKMRVGISRWRLIVVVIAFMSLALALFARMIYVQVFEQPFLQGQGDARSLRVVELQGMRGMILDRMGEPLAVSTPVDSLWANPQLLKQASQQQLKKLAQFLNQPLSALKKKLAQAQDKEFIYLKRQMSPDLAERAMQLSIPGLNIEREYRRYYPAGEAAAHVVGLVNLDGHGVEGLELAYDQHLKGQPGKLRVLKDRRGRIVQDLALLKKSEDGHPLVLSIDNRIQYIAYRELKKAVQEHQAVGGSVVVVKVKTGEILAMVNQPSYNPNNREGFFPDQMRNRAVTDVFEPGSTAKPFSLWVGLNSGQWTSDSVVDTSPGYMQVHRKTVRDIRNFGELSLRQVLRKSSNVGTAKVILSQPQEKLLEVYQKLGFGSPTYIEFPGERSGFLALDKELDPFTYATFAFGYGVSTTAVQLARAYAILSNEGREVNLTLLKRDATPPKGKVVLDTATTRTLREMLRIETGDGGSGQTAQVLGYSVGGKTGTVRKLGPEGYQADHHTAFFVGFTPVEQPEWVAVVVIDDPSGRQYYGGEIAAPVFGKMMRDVLRLEDVPMDSRQLKDMSPARVRSLNEAALHE